MKNSIYRLTGIISGLFILVNLSYSQTVTVDASTEYQTIRGFGGMNHPRWIEDMTPDMVDKAFGNTLGQIGLNILRMDVSPDTSDFYLEVPTAVYAKNLGAILPDSERLICFG